MQLEANKRQPRLFRKQLWKRTVYAGGRIQYSAQAGTSRERMRSSIASPSVSGDMRWTYQQNEHKTRTQQRNNSRMAQKAAVRRHWTEEGLRATIAYTVIVLLLVAFVSILAVGRAQIIKVEIQNRKILSRVNETQNKCMKLREDIDAAEASLFVGYAAVDLGLVSDNGVEKMMLKAPADAIVLPQSRQTGSR